MKHLIIESKAFNALDTLSQGMINRRANRIQIEDAIIQARNIGLETWKRQTDLPNKWKKIVEEIILKEQNDDIRV